jgi:hypothetical protein
MTNTAHTNCSHPATKAARARCRRSLRVTFLPVPFPRLDRAVWLEVTDDRGKFVDYVIRRWNSKAVWGYSLDFDTIDRRWSPNAFTLCPPDPHLKLKGDPMNRALYNWVYPLALIAAVVLWIVWCLS